jgi:hypothetical protein
MTKRTVSRALADIDAIANLPTATKAYLKDIVEKHMTVAESLQALEERDADRGVLEREGYTPGKGPRLTDDELRQIHELMLAGKLPPSIYHLADALRFLIKTAKGEETQMTGAISARHRDGFIVSIMYRSKTGY